MCEYLCTIATGEPDDVSPHDIEKFMKNFVEVYALSMRRNVDMVIQVCNPPPLLYMFLLHRKRHQGCTLGFNIKVALTRELPPNA